LSSFSWQRANTRGHVSSCSTGICNEDAGDNDIVKIVDNPPLLQNDCLSSRPCRKSAAGNRLIFSAIMPIE
jgi:hypothetical protein